jgi:hypothetical protein
MVEAPERVVTHEAIFAGRALETVVRRHADEAGASSDRLIQHFAITFVGQALARDIGR